MYVAPRWIAASTTGVPILVKGPAVLTTTSPGLISARSASVSAASAMTVSSPLPSWTPSAARFWPLRPASTGRARAVTSAAATSRPVYPVAPYSRRSAPFFPEPIARSSLTQP